MEYTYSDWITHKVVVSAHGGKIVYSEKDVFNIAPITLFINTDRQRIQEKQKELFGAKRIDLLNKWKDNFTKRYNQSSLKDVLIEDTINDWSDILFNSQLSPVHESDDVLLFQLRNGQATFTTEYLYWVRDYAQNIIKCGRDITYDFIHAPNCPYKERNIIAPPQVYAQAAFDFMMWVKEDFVKSIKPQKSNIDKLEWKGELKELKKLSRELKIRDYTNKVTDFEKVFTENKPTSWLKNAESLAYLLTKLYSLSPKKIYAFKKGYFLVAENYFHNHTDKVVKKFRLKDANHNIFTRYPEKYRKERESIDFILSEVFKISL